MAKLNQKQFLGGEILGVKVHSNLPFGAFSGIPLKEKKVLAYSGNIVSFACTSLSY